MLYTRSGLDTQVQAVYKGPSSRIPDGTKWWSSDHSAAVDAADSTVAAAEAAVDDSPDCSRLPAKSAGCRLGTWLAAGLHILLGIAARAGTEHEAATGHHPAAEGSYSPAAHDSDSIG